MNQMSLFGDVEESPAPAIETDPNLSAISRDEPDDEIELAAMRRALDAKGKRIGKDINAESHERFGTPIFKLPRAIVEWWLKVLDEQAQGAAWD